MKNIINQMTFNDYGHCSISLVRLYTIGVSSAFSRAIQRGILFLYETYADAIISGFDGDTAQLTIPLSAHMGYHCNAELSFVGCRPGRFGFTKINYLKYHESQVPSVVIQ